MHIPPFSTSERQTMIKIELEEVVNNYSDFIWKTIERWMSSRPDLAETKQIREVALSFIPIT